MTRYRLASLVAASCAVLFVSAGIAAAQDRLREPVNVPFSTDYELQVGSYVLPPGHYVLEHVDPDGFTWALHKDTLESDPIAMFEARNTNKPGRQGTEAFLTTVPSTKDKGPRLLQGFSVEGSYWEIRDVAAYDQSALKRADDKS